MIATELCPRIVTPHGGTPSARDRRGGTLRVRRAVRCVASDVDPPEDLSEEQQAAWDAYHGEDGPGGPCPGGGADPHPIPAPRDCTEEVGHEACYACCDWNVDNVWGARCHRIPKKNRNERRRCWEEAEARRKDCQLMCPRPDPITTLGVLP